jgi:hypothetical protein
MIELPTGLNLFIPLQNPLSQRDPKIFSARQKLLT